MWYPAVMMANTGFRHNDSMPESCIDRMKMHVVIKSEKRLRVMMDDVNCDDSGIPGYCGQHKISAQVT